MKQILQNLSSGVTELAEVPCPRVGAGQLLIRTTRSLISAGTERMLVEFGKAGWMREGATATRVIAFIASIASSESADQSMGTDNGCSVV